MKPFNQQWKKYRLRLLLVYATLIVLASLVVFRLPNIYQGKEKQVGKEVLSQIESILKLPQIEQEKKFDALFKQYTFTTLIMNQQGEIIFNPDNFTDIDHAQNSIDMRLVGMEALQVFEGAEGQYQVWFALYHLHAQQIISIWTFVFLVIMIAMFTILAITVLWVIDRLLGPIERLKKNLYKLTTLHQDQLVDVQQDLLNKQLNTFVMDVQDQMKQVKNEYSNLEMALQVKNEQMQNQSDLVGAMTHDLKVPIELAKFQIEAIINQTPLSMQTTMDTYHRLETAIQDINDIVKVVHRDIDIQADQSEIFDLVKLFNDTINAFHPFIKRKHMATLIDLPEQLFIETKRLNMKQLLYNSLSNVVQYGLNEGVVEIEIDNNENGLMIRIYNDAKQLDQEELNQVFNLFYRRKTEGDVTGSGTGLYTIQNIVHKLEGKCEFKNENNGVSLVITFNYNEHLKQVINHD